MDVRRARSLPHRARRRRLVAVGAHGAAAWSENGETWSGVPTGTTHDLVAVTWAGDRFVAGAKYGEFVESSDGASWTAMEPLVGRQPSALAWTGEELIVGTSTGILSRRLRAGETPPASAALRQLIPVTAHRSGIGGTEWRSDLHVTAASNEWTEVWLGLVAGDGGAPEWQRVALPPGGQLDRDDLVGRGFGLDDAAGPLLVVSKRPLAVSSRTFTGGAGGTYGQEIPAIPMAELVKGGTELVLLMLRQDGAFRTNLGVTNGSHEPIVVEIALFDAEGRTLGTVDRELPPLGWEQVDGALAEVGAAPLSDAYAVVSASPSTARFAAYASIVDAVTGDPTTIAGLPAAAEPLVVPAAGRGPGFAGTFWRSDLEVVNPGRDPAAYRIERLDGSAAVAFELAAGQAHRHGRRAGGARRARDHCAARGADGGRGRGRQPHLHDGRRRRLRPGSAGSAGERDRGWPDRPSGPCRVAALPHQPRAGQPRRRGRGGGGRALPRRRQRGRRGAGAGPRRQPRHPGAGLRGGLGRERLRGSARRAGWASPSWHGPR